MKNFQFTTDANTTKTLLKEIKTKYKNNDFELKQENNKVILYDYTKQIAYRFILNATDSQTVFML